MTTLETEESVEMSILKKHVPLIKFVGPRHLLNSIPYNEDYELLYYK